MKKAKCSCHPDGMTRRDLMIALGKLGLVAPIATGISPLYPLLNEQAMAQGSTPRRFIQIFLNGGWDSILATDPVLPATAKATGGKFEPAYYTPGGQYPGAPVTVSGKSNLVLGPGMAPAATAMAAVPSALINGIFVEVTAHELAVNYLYSGQPSLSRSREYPAIVATMADQTGGFPAHVILGGPIPLAATKNNNPPLQSLDTGSFKRMLAGPYGVDSAYEAETLDAAHTLIAKLNGEYHKRLGNAAKTGLSAWSSSESGLSALYAKRYDTKLDITPLLGAFNADPDQSDGIGARLATAALVLKEGVSRFCTVNMDGYDTHINHFSSHLGLMQGFATSLAGLLDFLAATNDPDTPSKKLIETTTVLVSSEFTRTPLFNAANGTDHWQSASAMLFGRGVQDNAVFGSTDVNGNATDQAAVGGGKLLPEHVAATILRALGFTAEANKISGVNIDDLFT